MNYKQETINPYHKGEKTTQVEQMFDNIAPTYDTLNHRLSWDIDKGWRKKAIRQLAPYQPQAILDIATGTGDFAILSAEMLKPARLVGADISEGMMEIGRKKVTEKGLQDIISFEKEDCLHLSYADNTYDAVTAAFGIRNFSNLDQGLKEMCRVLKTGGHLSIVELTTPVSFPMKQALPYLLPYGTACLWATDLQRHLRLLLSYQDHRGIPTRRADGGDTEKGRVQGGKFQTTDFWYLHDVFCNKIINKERKRNYGQVRINRLPAGTLVLHQLLQSEVSG